MCIIIGRNQFLMFHILCDQESELLLLSLCTQPEINIPLTKMSVLFIEVDK